MKPARFHSLTDIFKKIEGLAQLHSLSNFQVISQYFYDVIKVAFFAVKEKSAGILPQKNVVVDLKMKEISQLVKRIEYHYTRNKIFDVYGDRDLRLFECFGNAFNEADASRYFSHFVHGSHKDKTGRSIKIDPDAGMKFLYKNPETGRHEFKSEHYMPSRGKRLPWIKHTISTSSNVYGQLVGDIKQLMYVSQYVINPYGDEIFVVVATKYKKHKSNEFNFKTAFSITKYNSFLSRLASFRPVTDFDEKW